jgi:hypothetical protein
VVEDRNQVDGWVDSLGRSVLVSMAVLYRLVVFP